MKLRRTPADPKAASKVITKASTKAAKPSTKAGRSRKADAVELPAAVNLLSPWVLEELHVRSLRRSFATGTVALAVLVGLGWTGLRLDLYQAEQELRGEEAVATGLGEQIADLQPVRTYVDAIARTGLTVQETMQGEVTFSSVLQVLQEVLPPGATLGTLAVTMPTEPVVVDEDGVLVGDPVAGQTDICPGPDPFDTTIVVGCIELGGTAPSRADVSDLVVALAESGLFVEPFITTTTTAESAEVTFAGSVGLSLKALSTRYDDLVPAPEGQAPADAAPPTPDADGAAPDTELAGEETP